MSVAATTSANAARDLGWYTRVCSVGAAAGFLSGLFGVGGGILMVPALVLLLAIDQRRAHGTSLAAVLPISASSLITYIAHGSVDWPVAAALAIGAVGGALIGTKLLNVLPHRTLGYAFAGLLLATAIRLFIDTSADGRTDLTVLRFLALVLIGFATGILAGLLGVGGGIVMVPAMIVLFGITGKVAKGTSLAVIIPTAIMGTWRNRKHRNADLTMAAVLGVSGIVSAAAGGILADNMSDTTSNVLFAALLVVASAKLLWDLDKERRAARRAAAGLAA